MILDKLRRRPLPGVVTVAAVAVALGLLPMPPEYYVLLRWLLCGIAFWLLSRATAASEATRLLLVGLAVLFNPIVPIELPWAWAQVIAEVGAVAFFWAVDRKMRRAPGW